MKRIRRRATGIIIIEGKVLVFHRYRNGKWYYSFPGGGVEKGETPKQAMIREMQEELSIDVKKFIFLFSVDVKLDKKHFFDLDENPEGINKYSPVQYFYQITKFFGDPVLSGPEKEKESENNQYIIKWISISELKNYKNLFPEEGRRKLITLFDLA